MVTLRHNAWLCKWIQICMQIWQSTNSAKAIAPPSAWRGCSQSHVLPTRHLTALCSGFWSSMSFHQGSPEEWQKGKSDQIEGKIHSLISADARTSLHAHTPVPWGYPVQLWVFSEQLSSLLLHLSPPALCLCVKDDCSMCLWNSLHAETQRWFNTYL